MTDVLSSLDPRWKSKAKCASMDPELFDEDSLVGDKQAAAAKLCEGCPVIRECLMDATSRISMSQVVGEFGGKYLPEGEDVTFQSGVVRGGICLETVDLFPNLGGPDDGWS